jgi:hypothetical protein
MPMRIRWYNPALGAFEWRVAPETDEEAMTLMEEAPEPRICVDAYWKWRNLGATVVASFVRAGEAARDASCPGDEGG